MSAPISTQFPLAGSTHDGWSTETEATATCFCGAVQISFPTTSPGLVTTFICNCTDCHKITASMFASNFVVLDTHMKYLRGQDKLKVFSQSKTIKSGNTMSNHFCGECGTLMYRVSSGFPGMSITRIGTIDDFQLHETKIKPAFEQFIESRVGWLKGAEGVRQVIGSGL